jgi:hypothetical protein
VTVAEVARPGSRRDARWVVCLGELREIRGGAVRCPMTRRSVAVAVCLECHCLADSWDDRDRAAPCATGPELS